MTSAPVDANIKSAMLMCSLTRLDFRLRPCTGADAGQGRIIALHAARRRARVSGLLLALDQLWVDPEPGESIRFNVLVWLAGTSRSICLADARRGDAPGRR